MSKKLLAVIVIIGVLTGLAIYKMQSNKVPGITATGTIEITRTDITPKVSGYIGELLIKEGDPVIRGQLVARIIRTDLEVQKLRDEAALVKAEAQLVDLQKGSRAQELSEAQANIASGQAVYDKAKKDYERQQDLFQQGAVSAQQLDAARSTYEVAVNSLAAYQARASLIAEGNRPEVITAQQAEVERSQAIVQLAETALGDTVVRSPLDGVVFTKNFEQGEYVNAGAAIATIGNWRDCWVKVYISSVDIGLIKIGQDVTVKVDSFSDREFNGQIKEISQQAEFTPRQSITKQERANMVFAVKVKIDNSAGVLKPGMPADVVMR
ncbi:MAG: HlyD family efflux transporter periplasmic adaptor subunit [Sporomusaceae bacterium]|nr:HlyD family efflux transporter periplasmic adaptor subunit [Sporomusaceae bacterium]